jgi:coenzyme PQQ synthesis protein D (PqqD)
MTNVELWKVSPDVRATYSEDGAVLLHISRGLCYSLNPVAARIFAAVEGSPQGTSVDGIVTALETHFTVPRQVLLTDSAQCLEQFEQMGLASRNGNTNGTKGDGSKSGRLRSFGIKLWKRRN